MDLRDPAPGTPWMPDQYWVCPACGRHFWSTYPPPKKDEPKAADAKPATGASATAGGNPG